MCKAAVIHHMECQEEGAYALHIVGTAGAKAWGGVRAACDWPRDLRASDCKCIKDFFHTTAGFQRSPVSKRASYYVPCLRREDTITPAHQIELGATMMKGTMLISKKILEPFFS
ncbi:uncharacterized protein LOC144382391 [Halichoerus grypus]